MTLEEAMVILAELREAYITASTHRFPLAFNQDYCDGVINKRVQAIDTVLDYLQKEN